MRFLLALLAVLSGWFGMQACHELGHVIGALVSGGTIENVDLHPFDISRTDLALNPHPLLVVWAGPLVGVAIPLCAWGLARLLRLRLAFLLRFFAGFCLVANGAYIGVGSFDRVGDCGEMLRHGSPMWLLWLFGAIAVSSGFALWHGLARHFGFGANPAPIARNGVVAALVALCVFLAIGMWIGA